MRHPRPRLRALLPRPALALLASSAFAGFSYRHLSTTSNTTNDAGADEESPVLHPRLFTGYRLAERRSVGSGDGRGGIFVLRKDGGEGPSLEDWWTNKVWSVEVKQPQLQIARAYTPLPPIPYDTTTTITTTSADATPASTATAASATSPLRFWIRHAGEVSAYLHRLAPGTSNVSLRGPHAEFSLPPNTSDVLFLAGGTGIAPALQVAHALLVKRGEGGAERVRIMWAVRRREECAGGVGDVGGEEEGRWWGWLKGGRGWGGGGGGGGTVGEGEELGEIVREIEALKRAVRPGRKFEVQYFVDEEGSFIQPGRPEAQPEAQKQSGAQTPHPTKLILLAGPDGFLDAWAGRKLWAEKGEVQGPLRGALSRMDLGGWRVWKL
ncbi:uncharacterized protein K452DRAFT_278761 [Aplosporella prunicola CBS 121167]|uniref:FAD-binding FR-type domain-containing protein n=1 Tax=Aplosporella prunicola CBS 121167 TaxID=1176127 RepID=A0A6A6AZI1_9PEZI|nr:uncharacterized protein K452DRAFT_278761 [Aplosporella prunicola CBS 121167]KAF2137329.1 hypothetical protein K452DRAFT_278761 [Aplosporella prunicola CBS 121167]